MKVWWDALRTRTAEKFTTECPAGASAESFTILDMGAQTFEGVVEHGQIRLHSEGRIPEGAKVYVIVPGMEAEPERAHLRSPRLARKEQAADFEMEVTQP